jgi:hypothetical protein
VTRLSESGDFAERGGLARAHHGSGPVHVVLLEDRREELPVVFAQGLPPALLPALHALLRSRAFPPVAVAHPPARLLLLDDHHGATIPTRSDAKRRTDRREDRADSIRSRCRAKRALGRSERDRPDGRAVACAARAREAKISSRSARTQENFPHEQTVTEKTKEIERVHPPSSSPVLGCETLVQHCS